MTTSTATPADPNPGTAAHRSIDTDAYWRDGYLFPHRVMDGAEADVLRDELQRLEDDHSHDGALPGLFVDYARANLHVVSTAVARTARHLGVLDAVQDVLGPDISLWMAELIVKEPHSSTMLSMHQDLTYWGLDGADGLVTAWLALRDVTEANGAMRFVPGSHRQGQVEHRDTFGADNLLSRGQEVVVDVEPDDTVSVELSPGEMSLHHGLMFHGSGPNTTDHRRVGFVMRFVAPWVAQRSGASDYVMPCRSATRSASLISIAPPDWDFSPAALALHAEITAAQAPTLADGATEAPSYRRRAR